MTTTSGGARERRLSVPSMDCASCAVNVEGSLSGLDGVLAVEPLPAAGTVVVRFDPDATDEAAIVAAVEGAGYPVVGDGGEDRPSPHDVWRSRRAKSVWTGAVLLAAGIALEYLLSAWNPVLVAPVGYALTPAVLAYLGAAAVGGVAVLRGGYASLQARSLDIDLLMSAGILGALAVDLPLEAATLAVLFSVAELLEEFSMDRARNSLRELMDLSPDTATVRRDGEERTVPAEDVASAAVEAATEWGRNDAPIVGGTGIAHTPRYAGRSQMRYVK